MHGPHPTSGEHDLVAGQEHLRNSFESHAYEALLTTVLDTENEEYKLLDEMQAVVLRKLKNKVHGSNISLKLQEQILDLKDRLSRLLSRVAANKRALTDLLEDDASMALMNLSFLRKHPHLYRRDLIVIDCRLYDLHSNLELRFRWKSSARTRRSRT